MAEGLAKIAMHNRELATKTRVVFLVAKAGAAFENHGPRGNAIADLCLQAMAEIMADEVRKARATVARTMPLMEAVASEASDPRTRQAMVAAVSTAELFVNETAGR